jgi:hypothetical protein
MILGAGMYIGLLAGLSFVCGRPEGAEKTAVTRAYAVVARRFLRRGQETA